MSKTMKLSKSTIEVLKNFSSINSNILIAPGNKIKTLATTRSVMAECEIDSSFPQEFGIWDLNRFLSTISLFSEPEFEFHDKYVLIRSSKGSSVKYFYCEPSILTTTSKNISMPPVVVSFELSSDSLAEVLKSASVLQLNDIAFRSTKAGKIEVCALNKDDPSSNSYSTIVGDLPSGFTDEFVFYVKAENLKIIPGTYTVSLTETVVAKFENTTRKLSYYIALESDSVYKNK
jgi:hypothetical protein